jgi:hypothetical protein
LKEVKSSNRYLYPEHEAFRRLKTHLQNLKDADDAGERYFHMNLCTKCFCVLEEYYEIDLKDSGCMQQKKNLPIIRMGR